jgi:hypothetical protein
LVLIDCTGNIQCILETTRFYPNPTKKILTIETSISSPYNMQITSLNDQIIFSREFEGTSYHIDLNSFQKGVYIISVRSGDKVWKEKIIKL